MNLYREKNYWQQDIKQNERAAAIAKGMLILIGITYLFYNRWYAAIFLSPVLLVYLEKWKKEAEKKKKETFQYQFKDSMQALAAALSVGYSVENAIKEAAKDLQQIYLEDARIRKEFALMIHQLNMNFSAERVLKDFAKRVEQKDVENFVAVFTIAKRSGGDSVAIVKNTAKMLSDKIEVKREIQVMMAAKKYEFQVMTVIPLGIIFYMRISFSEFMYVLYGNVVGVIVMSICLGIYAAAYLLGRKVIEIEV